MENPDLLDYREAAEFLGLSEFTLRRYVSMRRLPFIKVGAKLVRFEPARLLAWIESQRVEPRTGRP
ncbi:MAG: DNA-binding protein [Methanothrix sp.]|nr:MAG: DNA-binding protein [Methanothrix sp.]